MTKSLVLETTGRYLVLLNNVNTFGVILMSDAIFQSTLDNVQVAIFNNHVLPVTPLTHKFL